MQRQGVGGGEISVYAPSLIVPAGQEQSTVLSYSNISCESVNEVKRGAKKRNMLCQGQDYLEAVSWLT